VLARGGIVMARRGVRKNVGVVIGENRPAIATHLHPSSDSKFGGLASTEPNLTGGHRSSGQGIKGRTSLVDGFGHIRIRRPDCKGFRQKSQQFSIHLGLFGLQPRQFHGDLLTLVGVGVGIPTGR
jgi:hypothetical protein